MKTKDNIQILREDASLTEAVRRNTELLPTMPTNLNERVMRQMTTMAANKQAARKKVWLCAAILSAVAASIVLLLMLKTPVSESEKIEPDRIPHIASVPNSDSESAKTTDSLPLKTPIVPQELAKDRIQPLLTSENVPKPEERIISTSVVPKTRTVLGTLTVINEEQTVMKKVPAPEVADYLSEEYADTLGKSIFESPENVLIAMQMLAECETVIQQETQRVRNNLIEATFEVLPPSKETILVKEENGDLNLMDTRHTKIIEL